MVTGASVDGLVSGMQTSSVIASLMQVEAMPQTALKQKMSVEQTVVSSYQSINTKMSALLTAARALTDPLAFKGATASASSDGVLATTSNTGSNATGSVSFRVTSLASSETHVFANGSVASTSDSIVSGSSINIALNGASPGTDVPITDHSLKGVVDTINQTANLGVKASAIQIAPNQYTLQLTSTATGKASTFAVTGVDGLGTDTVTSVGSDASLTIGTQNPIVITSASNTFTGLMDGLTVTAKKVTADSDPPITVSVTSDTDGIATKVQAMIDAANGALTEISNQTRNQSGTTPAAPLAGNGSMQQLASTILQTVSGGAGSLGSLKSVGIQLTRDGRLTFDKAAFTAALNADPVKTQSYFVGTGTNAGNGIGDKLSAAADKATQSNTGTLASLINSGNSMIKDLTNNISDWDTRLSQRQETLQRQFTAMETALGSLKNQSSWLAGQLSSLG
jgi:flagellar hook-associated protein 2